MIELDDNIRAAMKNPTMLSSDQQIDLLEVLKDYTDYQTYNKLYSYEPDDPMLEFFDKGYDERIRGLIAANRCGKSYAGTFEVAVHATGLYPNTKTHKFDWDGVEYRKHTHQWVLGYTMESICSPGNLRDLLFGPPDMIGSGWIPLSKIHSIEYSNIGKGIIKSAKIRHVKKGLSTIGFRVYSQGMGVLMGSNLDSILIDESPKDDSIFPQLITRVQKAQDGKGRIMVTATPEFGMQPLISDFYNEDGQYHKGYTSCSVYQVSHISDEDVKKMEHDIPARQHDMRLKGIPVMGSGMIYPFKTEEVTYSDIPIETHWKIIQAVDFGWTAPAAVVSCAYDPDTQIVYIYRAEKNSEWEVPIMASYINTLGTEYPVIWPHDGANGTQAGSGIGLKEQLASNGCNMHWTQFANPPDPITGKENNSVEAGLSELRTMFKTNALKVHHSLTDLLNELSMYYYEENTQKPKKTNDHIMDAMRYAVQSVKRFGKSKNDGEFDSSDYQNYIEDEQ